MKRFFAIFIFTFVVAFILMFAFRVKACDNLPIFVILNPISKQVLFEADSATYNGKLHTWTFYDKLTRKGFDAAPEKVLVAAMGGEYRVRGDGHVVYVSTRTGLWTTLPFDGLGFQQTTIDERLDDRLQER